MNFSNLSFLNPIHLLRCQPSCVNDRHLNSKSFIENSKVLTKDIISPVKLQFVLRRSIWFFYRFFFYNSFCILISVWVFSNKSWFYSACNMPIVIVSTMGRQYRQTFNPISNLWAISKILKLRFPHYIVLFVITLFTADTKEKKKNRDVPNKKLFQIHSGVFTKGSLVCKLNAIFYGKSTIV